jgi:hypothetical protein
MDPQFLQWYRRLHLFLHLHMDPKCLLQCFRWYLQYLLLPLRRRHGRPLLLLLHHMDPKLLQCLLLHHHLHQLLQYLQWHHHLLLLLLRHLFLLYLMDPLLLLYLQWFLL